MVLPLLVCLTIAANCLLLSFSVSFSSSVLLLLVVQNSTLIICMRYTRVTEGPLYAVSTAVVAAEVRVGGEERGGERGRGGLTGAAFRDTSGYYTQLLLISFLSHHT
jgi:hypothetical protein